MPRLASWILLSLVTVFKVLKLPPAAAVMMTLASCLWHATLSFLPPRLVNLPRKWLQATAKSWSRCPCYFCLSSWCSCYWKSCGGVQGSQGPFGKGEVATLETQKSNIQKTRWGWTKTSGREWGEDSLNLEAAAERKWGRWRLRRIAAHHRPSSLNTRWLRRGKERRRLTSKADRRGIGNALWPSQYYSTMLN